MSTTPQNPQLSFIEIHRKALALGLTAEQIRALPSVRRLKAPRRSWIKTAMCFVLSVVILLCAMAVAQWPVSRETLLEYYFDYYDMDLDKESCILELSDTVLDLARPPVSCSICEEVREVDRVSGITPEIFEERYAYTGRPVVIQDGMRNWTATKIFSFDFFKHMYTEDSPALVNQEANCQFFPYKTTFGNLGEALNMSSERAQLMDGQEPWYFGWSNCDSTVANMLRQHYQRPYFLPKVSESSKTDWIFMGSPGYGAHMHIDNVRNPSWQAQVTGTKLWTIEPPPECYHVCSNALQVTIHPGEIFVFDSNLWFHSTNVQGDEVSICIGSEFD